MTGSPFKADQSAERRRCTILGWLFLLVVWPPGVFGACVVAIWLNHPFYILLGAVIATCCISVGVRCLRRAKTLA